MMNISPDPKGPLGHDSEFQVDVAMPSDGMVNHYTCLSLAHDVYYLYSCSTVILHDPSLRDVQKQ